MSLLDDVSIVVTPNGYKAGTLYGVIPVPSEGAEKVSDGNFLLTGTQAQNTTGTYWTTGTGITISGGSANFTGNSNADIRQSIGLVTGTRYRVTFTISNYVSGDIDINVGGATRQGSYAANGDYTIDVTSDSGALLYFQEDNAGGGVGFTGSISNISVKELTSADMDVTRATAATRVDEDGLISDVLSGVPRIDYAGCPHILAEPARTNLIPYSEDFSSWTTTSATLTPNQLSPDGTNNAYIIEDDNATGSGYEKVDVTITTTATPCTLSVFIKKKTSAVSSYSGIQMSTGFSYLIFDSYNGTYNLNSSPNYDNVEVENFNSDWWRLKLTGTVTTSTRVALWGAISTNGTTLSPTATGSETFWGAQLEQASYATSYIPTSGSTVTRNQDQFTRDGIGSLINSTEGVLFVEMAALADDGVAKYITMNDGSSNNDVRIYFNTASNGISALLKSTTGATQAFLSYTVTDTTAFHKIAFVYAVNRFELWVDGEKRAEDLSGIAPVGLTTLEFSRASNFLPLFAKVKQLQVYTTALSPTQLAALTT